MPLPLPNFDVQKMLDSAKALFRKSDSVIGLDIGSSVIKVVQLRREQGRAVLETYGGLALGPYGGLDVGRATNLPLQKIIEAIKDLFREANVTANVASIALPLSGAFLTLIELPEVDDNKLAAMVPLEARKFIPVPITEVTLDWLVLPKQNFHEGENAGEKTPVGGPIPKVSVMVVAIHNQVLTKYQEVVAKTGLQKTNFEIEVYSSIRATIGHDMSPIMFIDMGAGITKLAIVEQGIIRNVHMVSRGSQEITMALSRGLNTSITKAEKIKRDVGFLGKDEESLKVVAIIESTVSYIFTEANRVLLDYQNKNNISISKVILTGGGVLLKGLSEHVKKWIEAEIIFGNSFAKLEYPAFLESALSEAGPEFSVAVGLALKRLQDIE